MKQEYSFEDRLGDEFKSYISEAKSQIESELAEVVQGVSELSLHSQIKYAVSSQGKRLRPLLVVLSAESVGGKREKIMPLALAFELMHTATLVHDDIIDQDNMRRDRPAMHKKWSADRAILAGDALIALAVGLSSTYGESIIKTVANSALTLCDGENMDISFSPQMMTEKSYFERIRKKSASLFQAATYCGALAGGGTSAEVDALSSFGLNYGMAYQLRDDLHDLANEGTDALKDLRRGRLTLPLIHSYNIGSTDDRKQITNTLQILLKRDSDQDLEATKKILEMIRKTGSQEYCDKRMNGFLNQAVASISKIRKTECKTYLGEMVKTLKSTG